MNRELKRKGIISIAVHAAVITFFILRFLIACHHIDTRNISPFIDLQMGAQPGGMKGRAGIETSADKDDSFPEPARKTKGQVEVSKKLVKRPVKATAKTQLSENEIRRMLGEGVASIGPAGSQTGSGQGAGGTYHPYAWYLLQVRSIMYDAWQQPSSLIGKKGLVTGIEIRVQRDGQITGKKMVSPSGNAQMDDSVLRALESVSRLPELPAGFGGLYKDITIDFELTASALPPGE